MRSAVLIRHNLALLAAEPGAVISRIVMPLAIITVLRPLYTAAIGPQGTAYAVTGALVLFSLLGLSIVGGSLLTERTWHTLDRVRTTPARPIEILVGKAVPLGGVLLAQQAVVFSYGVVVMGMRVARPDLLALAALAWAATLLALGALAAMLVRSHSELGAVNDLGALVLTTLGGAMVPLSLLPAWARAVAPASPGYWAMRAMHGAVTGAAATTATSAAVLIGVATAAATLAAWRMSRGWGRSRLL
ncbi:ABC transporter permease [Catellatospora tritici]|uniref:ABC transporter permease n=1 Tax=Catellatospora tritici TaxID=2851566 RepID=UPI001C2D433B|nr:ABC transporter permease [Catellatospora tritici]MBV1850272.1 ABC transporter permease [Catellatospora tritici]